LESQVKWFLVSSQRGIQVFADSSSISLDSKDSFLTEVV
jgi:hypothetical protein